MDIRAARLRVDEWMEGYPSRAVGSRSVKPLLPLTSVKCRGDVTLDTLISLVLTCTLAHGSTCWILARSAGHRCSVLVGSAAHPPSARVCKRKAKLVWLRPVCLQATTACFACQNCGDDFDSTDGTSAGGKGHCKCRRLGKGWCRCAA